MSHYFSPLIDFIPRSAEQIEVNFREMADENGVSIKHDPNGVAVSTYTITKGDYATFYTTGIK